MSTITELWLYTPQGPFQFQGAEVPEQIQFGGQQMLCTHKMIGGLRVVDAMGPDDVPLTWSGIFLYNEGGARARFLDYLRRSGLLCQVAWGDFQYNVVISEFKADFKKPFWIPFTITCEVVQDQTNSIALPPVQSPEDALNADSATMTQLATNIGDPTISGLAASASSAVAAVTSAAQPIANGLVPLNVGAVVGEVAQVSTISKAAVSAIAAASERLAEMHSGVQAMISKNNGIISAVPVLGQILPGQPVAGQVSTLVAQCTASVQLPSLLELSAVTSRMQMNLALVASPGGTKVSVVGGGNLYQMAAQAYKDATRWTDIAQASGIADPMMTGFNTVTVPQ